MITIGLAGTYCAGKDTCAQVFKDRGALVIDVDKLGHQVLQDCRKSIADTFGPSVVSSNGDTIDRMKLGVLVFSDPSKLALLESMLHPRMATAIMLQLEDARRKNLALVVLNAALLHRMHLDVLCDAVCFVDAPACIRYFRARKRDGATVGSFRRRLAAQHDVRLQDIQCQGNVYLVKNFLGKGFIHRQVTALCVTMGV